MMCEDRALETLICVMVLPYQRISTLGGKLIGPKQAYTSASLQT